MNDNKPLLHQDLPEDIAVLLRAGREDAPPSNNAENAALDGALRAAKATSRPRIGMGPSLVALASLALALALTLWSTVDFRPSDGRAAARPLTEPSPTPTAPAQSEVTTPSGPDSAERAASTEPGIGVLALPDAPPLKPSSRDEADDDGLAVIDRAREALASGRPAECLGRLAHYRAAYRQRAYDEEAYALEVQALAGLERQDEAEAKARVFFSRYPRSPYAARLRAALGGSR